jgi:hypothetical protein
MRSALALSSVTRDLLGHSSIVVTERYDKQRPEALMAAAKRSETGESFTFAPHSSAEERPLRRRASPTRTLMLWRIRT